MLLVELQEQLLLHICGTISELIEPIYYCKNKWDLLHSVLFRISS